MSILKSNASRPQAGGARARQSRKSATRAEARVGMAFSSLYVLILFFFGILPSIYATYLAFTKRGAFVGFANFAKVFRDYRFIPAAEHVGLYLLFWLVSLVVLVVLLAVIVHSVGERWLSTTLRFVYYIPGAFAGAASVMLWLFVLNPKVSPVGPLLHLFGFKNLIGVVQPDNLPVVLAVIAFWTGAGGWVVIMYGALNNISHDIMEAARMDGAGPIRIAWSIQIPLLRKWISYMVILSFAAGTQLFVEPRVLAQASRGIVPQSYSLNQLAYLYAFEQADFNGSAAIALLLLVVALGLSAIFVFKGGLFERA